MTHTGDFSHRLQGLGLEGIGQHSDYVLRTLDRFDFLEAYAHPGDSAALWQRDSNTADKSQSETVSFHFLCIFDANQAF